MAQSRRLAAVARNLSSGSLSSPHDFDHRRPVALVIGAGSGIGQAVAAKFAQVHRALVSHGHAANSLHEASGSPALALLLLRSSHRSDVPPLRTVFVQLALLARATSRGRRLLL